VSTTAIGRVEPNWFTVGMGTGITAVAAYTLAGAPAWLRHIGVALWLANSAVVAVLSALFVLRLALERGALRRILRDPVQSMFLGAIPMALATIVNGTVDMGRPLLGPVALVLAERLWLIDVVLALASAVVVPYVMFVVHDHRLERMTGIWLMPFVPPEVAAASGGLFLPHVADRALAQALVTASLVLWAVSVPIAFLLLGVLLLRLAVHSLPPRELAVSTWITLGTLGTGMLGLIGLGGAMPLLFGPLGRAMDGASILAATALWGFGLWWLTMSLLLTLHQLRRGLPFNLGWWGLTFPLGVFAAGTNLLAVRLGVAWIGVMATILFALLAAFWALVATRTAVGLGRAAWAAARRPPGAAWPLADAAIKAER
jgi:C4-dicarboxylate transporter/malic acid transport protein